MPVSQDFQYVHIEILAEHHLVLTATTVATMRLIFSNIVWIWVPNSVGADSFD
jgi:hypothetical protein